jgi:hypothetical protein
MRLGGRALLLTLLAIAVGSVGWHGTSVGGAEGPRPASPAPIGALPVTFEANRGQTAAEVRFVARASRYHLFLTPTEVVLTFAAPASGSATGDRLATRRALPRHSSAAVGVVRLRFVGADSATRLVGREPAPFSSHYLIGRDPRRWLTAVPNFATVVYEALSPGVDLRFRGHRGHVVVEAALAPGADRRAIVLDVHGDAELTSDPRGDLLIATAAGTLRLQRPQASREGHTEPAAGAGRPMLIGARRVALAIERVDPAQAVAVVPVLEFVADMGGDADDEGFGVAVDARGSAYLTGATWSVTFPTTADALRPRYAGGHLDAFVAKLAPSGATLEYATFIGGSEMDVAYGIAVDAAGSAYITGQTESPDFPVTAGAFQPAYVAGRDGFVAKLNPAGSGLVYASYLGGSGYDQGLGIAVDAAGYAYVGGETISADFPATAGAFDTTFNAGGVYGSDGFVAKINPTGTALVYATYLGGSGDDRGRDIAADAAGNAYVTGFTTSADFPIKNPLQAALRGAQDAFVAAFDPMGTLLYATYLGGSGGDVGRGIAVDRWGNTFVTGFTSSPDFPLVSPVQRRFAGAHDVFVAVLHPQGRALLAATYMGGAGDDRARGIALDPFGAAVIAGHTTSPDFAGPRGVRLGDGGRTDAFVVKLQVLRPPRLYFPVIYRHSPLPQR